MQAEAKSDFLRLRQNSPGRWNFKVSALAEYIAIFGQVFRRDARQHFVDDKVYVGIRIVSIFIGHSMRTEKSRHEFNGGLPVQVANDTEDFQFVFQGKPVSGFRFHRGRPALQEPARVFQRLLEQLLFAGRARFPDRRTNAASCFCDFLVGRASRAQLKLIHAVSGKNGMSMGVDKTG